MWTILIFFPKKKPSTSTFLPFSFAVCRYSFSPENYIFFFFLVAGRCKLRSKRRRRQELLSGKYFRSLEAPKTCFNCNLLLFFVQTQQQSFFIVVRLSFKVASRKKIKFLSGMEISFWWTLRIVAPRETKINAAEKKRTSSSSMSELNDFDKWIVSFL